MIIDAFGTGATVEQARESAKRNLDAPEEVLVQFEVIEQGGKKKLFGIFGGSTDAKVRAFYDDSEIKKPEPVKAEPIKEEPKKEEPKKAEPKKKPEQKKAEKPENAEEKPEKKTAPKAEKKQPAKAPEKEKVEKSQPKKAEEKPVENAEKPVEKPAEKPAKKPKKVVAAAQPVNNGEIKVDTSDAVIDYLTAVIRAMGIADVVVTGFTDSANIRNYSIMSESEEGSGALIGHHGDTLDAFQHLARLISNKAGENYARITINVGDYREKRSENLRTLASRNARQVLRFGRNVTLEPMNPYERRIIHTAIQEIDGVSSHSVGSGAGRRVVITLDEGVEPTNKSEKKQNSRKQPAVKTKASEENAPKQDSVGTSRYGKIEVPGATPKEKPAKKEKPVAEAKPKKTVGGALYGKIEVKKPDTEE